MSELTARFDITEEVIGLRAHCVATVHGTAGQAINDPDIHIPAFADRFNLGGQPKPLYVVKAHHPDDLTTGWPAPVTAGIADQFTEAQAAGYNTMLQVVQLKDPGENPYETPTACGQRADTLLRAIGVDKCDFVAITNEGNIDSQFADADELAAFQADAVAELEKQASVATSYVVPRLCIGHLASYAAIGRWTAAMVPALRAAGVATQPELFATHQYKVNPKLALREHRLHIQAQELSGLPVANLETDYGFSGGNEPPGFQDVPHAIYALVNNLEHAYHNIPCADFVFMNSDSQTASTIGNGIYQSDGDANAQAEAFEDILADFTAQALVKVDELNFNEAPGIFCYANQGREVVVANMPSVALDDITDDFSMSLRGREGGHFVEADILDYLRGEGPEPSSTPPQARLDWPAFKRRAWAAYRADNTATVEIRFKEPSQGFTLVKSLAWRGVEPTWDWGTGALTVTLPPYTALYLRGVM